MIKKSDAQYIGSSSFVFLPPWQLCMHSPKLTRPLDILWEGKRHYWHKN